jgi:hypothetical protein
VRVGGEEVSFEDWLTLCVGLWLLAFETLMLRRSMRQIDEFRNAGSKKAGATLNTLRFYAGLFVVASLSTLLLIARALTTLFPAP